MTEPLPSQLLCRKSEDSPKLHRLFAHWQRPVRFPGWRTTAPHRPGRAGRFAADQRGLLVVEAPESSDEDALQLYDIVEEVARRPVSTAGEFDADALAEQGVHVDGRIGGRKRVRHDVAVMRGKFAERKRFRHRLALPLSGRGCVAEFEFQRIRTHEQLD